jgi:hypothetical protein
MDLNRKLDVSRNLGGKTSLNLLIARLGILSRNQILGNDINEKSMFHTN